MKKIILSLIAAVSLISIPFVTTSCTTIGGQPNTNQVAQISAVVETAAYTLSAIDVSKNVAHYNYYVAIGSILGGITNPEQLTPEAVLLLLKQSGSLDSPEALIAVNSVINLYKIYFSENVSGQISKNEWAKALLTSVSKGVINGSRDGKAIADAQPPKPPKTNTVVKITTNLVTNP